MNVLIACEESQIECAAFRAKGHNAFSCDIQECSGGHPEWHIMGDVRLIFGEKMLVRTQNGKMHYIAKWDLIIAHPPCTYITKCGSRWFLSDPERKNKQKEAVAFFYEMLNAPAEKVCVENPTPLKAAGLPQPSFIAQPYEFGEFYSKRLCYWTKGLPPLYPTCYASETVSYHAVCARNSKARSKSFASIAAAMAEQWG